MASLAAAYRASTAALRFKPPDLSLLDHPKTMLCAGKGAALVRFFAEPQRLFAAIEAKARLYPIDAFLCCSRLDYRRSVLGWKKLGLERSLGTYADDLETAATARVRAGRSRGGTGKLTSAA